MKNYNIYIDNGDKEQTLCRSNEELHILMRNYGFPHEFRVREGGHSFSYWCSALPNALHFLSDAFEAKPYRGDIEESYKLPPLPELQIMKLQINHDEVMAYVPAEYYNSTRLYPVLYLAGNFSLPQMTSISARVNEMINLNRITPMLLVFVAENSVYNFSGIYPEIEEKLRIRKGYRFRSMLGIQGSAGEVCDIIMNRVQFSSCVLVDAYLEKDIVIKFLDEMKPGALKKTPFFVIAPDKGNYYDGNGNLHMILRDKEIQHEYRVMQGSGGPEIWMTVIEKTLTFVSDNFHR